MNALIASILLLLASTFSLASASSPLDETPTPTRTPVPTIDESGMPTPNPTELYYDLLTRTAIPTLALTIVYEPTPTSTPTLTTSSTHEPTITSTPTMTVTLSFTPEATATRAPDNQGVLRIYLPIVLRM
jgi:hypothetical protein